MSGEMTLCKKLVSTAHLGELRSRVWRGRSSGGGCWWRCWCDNRDDGGDGVGDKINIHCLSYNHTNGAGIQL